MKLMDDTTKNDFLGASGVTLSEEDLQCTHFASFSNSVERKQ